MATGGGSATGGGGGTGGGTTLQTEIEPNETKNQADANGLVLEPGSLVSGTLGASEADVYKLQLSVGSVNAVVRAELKSPNGCNAIDGVSFALLLSTGVEHVKAVNEDGCLTIVKELAHGTYYVAIARLATGTPVPYTLRISISPSAGGEVEPNDSTFSASLLGTTDGFKIGNIASGADHDYYELTVSQPSSVDAEIIEVTTANACEALSLDSTLRLETGAGLLLVEDYDEGRGYCSHIDPNWDGNAKNLAPGTYFLHVRHHNTSSLTGFAYRLVVRITPQ